MQKAGKIFGLVLLLVVLSGCASSKQFVGARPFDFQTDTFAFGNELVYEYYFDLEGRWVNERHQPEPTYTLHCFVLARSARQFFQNATFNPSLPVADDRTYRKLVRRVVSTDPATVLPAKYHVVIPGYPDLRSFSSAHEQLLKEECGGTWHSYFQRGNWRIAFPFFRSHQARTAAQLTEALRENRPPIIHLGGLPDLTLNHCILLFAYDENESEIRFWSYDPNEPYQPIALTFNRTARTFYLRQNGYFPGGALNIYEIYRSWCY